MSVIDKIPLTVTGGICPFCGQYTKVKNGKFVEHKDLQRKVCPESGCTIPKEWR